MFFAWNKLCFVFKASLLLRDRSLGPAASRWRTTNPFQLDRRLQQARTALYRPRLHVHVIAYSWLLYLIQVRSTPTNMLIGAKIDKLSLCRYIRESFAAKSTRAKHCAQFWLEFRNLIRDTTQQLLFENTRQNSAWPMRTRTMLMHSVHTLGYVDAVGNHNRWVSLILFLILHGVHVWQ